MDEKISAATANASQGVVPNLAQGLDPQAPESVAALNEMKRVRGMDIARGAIMGAGAGAGVQATNPMAAFLQGAALGMQAPAQIYEQKRKTIESAVDAMPFGVTHKDLIDKDPRYADFAGLPTKIALSMIQTVATDAAKIKAQGEQERQSQAEKFKFDIGLKSFEASLKGKDPAKYEDISAMAKDFRSLEPVVQYQTAKIANEMIKQAPDDGAGDLMIMANYARILNPQTRFSEGNLEATDVSSTFDKYTMGLWNRVVEGKRLSTDERNKLRAASMKAFSIRRNEYQNVADLWEQKATEYGIDPDFVVSDKGWETKYVDGKPVMARQLANGKWEVRPQ